MEERREARRNERKVDRNDFTKLTKLLSWIHGTRDLCMISFFYSVLVSGGSFTLTKYFDPSTFDMSL